MREDAEYVSASYDLIPLYPREKIPKGDGWQTRAALSLEEADKWRAGGGNIGVRLRAGQLVVDVDPRNGGSVAALEAWCESDLGQYPMVLTPSGGCHIYMLVNSGLKLRHTLAELPGVEFKSLGRQVVAVGSTHPNGGLYEWDLARGCLPAGQAPHGLVTRALARDKNNDEHGTWSLDELRRALEVLDVREYADHDRWFSLMCACHEATGGEGVNVFCEWSAADPQYAGDSGLVRARWMSLHAGREGNAGIGTLRSALVEVGRGDLVVPDVAGDFEDDAVAAVVELPETLMVKMCRWFKAVDEDGRLRVFAQRHDEALDRKYWVRYTRRDFLEVCTSVMHLPQTMMQMGDKEKPVASGLYWLDYYKKKVTYRGVTFAPECPEDRTPGGKLNLWRGFAVVPKKGTWDYLRELTWETLCLGDDVSFQYVLRWMARATQMPWEPGRVAVAFRGRKGTGKSTLGTYWMKLFGKHGMHITSPSLLTGRFNAHLRDTVALFADEAFWAGDRAGEGVLKGLVTEGAISYEGKGQNAEMGRNCVHLMLAANGDWVVPATADERRFAVFNVDDDTHSPEYWKKLRAEMSTGGLAAMLYDLQDMDLSEFDVTRVPATAALAQQKMESLGSHERWLYDMALSGDWGGMQDYGGGLYLVEDVTNSFLAWCRSHSVRGLDTHASAISIGIRLRKTLLGLQHLRAKVASLDKQKYFYVLPSCEEVLKILEDNLGL